MDIARLVYMANQIGKFFETEDAKSAVAMTADHLKKFWDPRMRSAIIAHVDAGGQGLDGPVEQAVRALKPKADKVNSEW